MKIIFILGAPVLSLVASAAAAQAPVSPHQQHQSTGQHQARSGEDRCCCDEEMRKMMMEMMEKHQRMGLRSSGSDGNKDKAQPQDQHKH